MASKPLGEHIYGHAKYQLPARLSREIGRIIVHWAHFEYLVQDMVWETMKVSNAVGRIAVREPRVTDRLEMLRDLVKVQKGFWDDELFNSIFRRAKLIAARRDLLAHGIWDEIPEPRWPEDVWHLQLTRGSWPKNFRDLVAASKKIDPQLVPITLALLKETTIEIEQMIQDLKKLRSSAHTRTPRLPEKPR